MEQLHGICRSPLFTSYNELELNLCRLHFVYCEFLIFTLHNYIRETGRRGALRGFWHLELNRFISSGCLFKLYNISDHENVYIFMIHHPRLMLGTLTTSLLKCFLLSSLSVANYCRYLRFEIYL